MPAVRIELTTYRLQGGCSTAELSRPRSVIAQPAGCFKKSRLGWQIPPRWCRTRRRLRTLFPGTSLAGAMRAIIAWVVLGLIAGFIASKIVSREGAGCLLDIVLGIVGAFVGGIIFTA